MALTRLIVHRDAVSRFDAENLGAFLAEEEVSMCDLYCRREIHPAVSGIMETAKNIEIHVVRDPVGEARKALKEARAENSNVRLMRLEEISSRPFEHCPC